MTFHEKSTALMTVIMAVVYGWYFYLVMSQLDGSGVDGFPYQGYQGPLLVTVIALVVLAVIGHIVIAVLPSYDGDASDERDLAINMRGEYFGGYVLGTGAVVVLLLAMVEVAYFWIANVMLLALVLSEIVTGIVKLSSYRRMG